MTWTYGGDPTANDRDEVRFLCGDRDSTDELLSDEEIAYLITEAGSNTLAAAMACEAIAAEFARDVDTKNGPASESASQRYKQFLARAKSLRSRAFAGAKPVFGGQSISGKKTLAADADVPQPYFSRGWSDSPGAPSHIGGGAGDDEST